MAHDPRATTAYASIRFAPRPGTRVYRISDKQRAWMVRENDVLLQLICDTYGVAQLSDKITPKDVRAAIADVRASWDDIVTAQLDALTSDSFDGLQAAFTSYRHAVAQKIERNRAIVRSALERRLERPIAAPAPAVTDGRYAVEHAGDLRFYRVTSGTGRWTGRTFVVRMSSDDELRISRTESDTVLAAIAQDPAAARARYGKEIGRCGRCNRTLTSEYRELGIGPECIKK